MPCNRVNFHIHRFRRECFECYRNLLTHLLLYRDVRSARESTSPWTNLFQFLSSICLNSGSLSTGKDPLSTAAEKHVWRLLYVEWKKHRRRRRRAERSIAHLLYSVYGVKCIAICRDRIENVRGTIDLRHLVHCISGRLCKLPDSAMCMGERSRPFRCFNSWAQDAGTALLRKSVNLDYSVLHQFLFIL